MWHRGDTWTKSRCSRSESRLGEHNSMATKAHKARNLAKRRQVPNQNSKKIQSNPAYNRRQQSIPEKTWNSRSSPASTESSSPIMVAVSSTASPQRWMSCVNVAPSLLGGFPSLLMAGFGEDPTYSALALGATCCFIGRVPVWGLAVSLAYLL